MTKTVIGKPPKGPINKAKTVIGNPDLGDGDKPAISRSASLMPQNTGGLNIRRNPWMSNPYLQGQATAVAERFARQGIKGAEQLRRVEREMRERFGDMISEYEHGKPGNPSSRVDRTARSRRDWNSIPASERKILTDAYIRTRGGQRLPDTPATYARLAKSWWDANYPEED